MIRYTLLTLFVGFLCVYAWKDWYKSLCGLIVMMAIIERADMPRQMLGITGLNPWNITMLFILMGWFIARKREALKWDMPRETSLLLVCYLLIIVIGFVRMIDHVDMVQLFYANANYPDPPLLKDLFIDDIINSLKYVIPGLLLFHGCNSESRLRWGIAAILLTFLLVGLQIISRMPIGYISDGEALAARALRVLNRSIGYHRVDLAALMSAGSWAFFVSRQVFEKAWQSRVMLLIGLVLILSLALTGGRTGYATWVALGLMVATLKYRKLLAFVPVLVLLIVFFIPAVQERMLQGFGSETGVQIVGEQSTNLESVTSGRILVWPYVIEGIKQRPLLGWGRRGFHGSGVSVTLFDEIGRTASGFNHPHNAYLQLILDNGLIGAFPILLFFAMTMKRSISLFRDRESPLIYATGGICMLLTGAQLIASVGAQSFYPRAGVVLMWCSIGLMYAVYSRSRYRERASMPAWSGRGA